MNHTQISKLDAEWGTNMPTGGSKTELPGQHLCQNQGEMVNTCNYCRVIWQWMLIVHISSEANVSFNTYTAALKFSRQGWEGLCARMQISTTLASDFFRLPSQLNSAKHGKMSNGPGCEQLITATNMYTDMSCCLILSSWPLCCISPVLLDALVLLLLLLFEYIHIHCIWYLISAQK